MNEMKMDESKRVRKITVWPKGETRVTKADNSYRDYKPSFSRLLAITDLSHDSARYKTTASVTSNSSPIVFIRPRS